MTLEPRILTDAASGRVFTVYVTSDTPTLPGELRVPPVVETLAEARVRYAAALQASIEAGDPPTCPCCDRTPGKYRRKFNSGMAKVLVDLYRLGRGPAMAWVNVVKLFPGTSHRGGEWALMRHWGVVTPGGKRTAVANSNGDWRLTPLGVAFVEDQLPVVRHITFLEGEPVKREGEIRIREALGNAFSYPELMGITETAP